MMSNREVTLLIDTPYRPDPGAFCKSRGMVSGRYQAGQWYKCREIWHNELKEISLFFYSHISGKMKAVANFMNKIEDMLDVRPRSRYGPTQRKTICWIEPSGWWIRGAMRRSLFTILLRVSQQYKDESNFEQALFSHKYTIDTKYAVNRFLKGYTNYTGRRRGWVNQFSVLRPTEKEIDELLIKKA